MPIDTLGSVSVGSRDRQPFAYIDSDDEVFCPDCAARLIPTCGEHGRIGCLEHPDDADRVTARGVYGREDWCFGGPEWSIYGSYDPDSGSHFLDCSTCGRGLDEHVHEHPEDCECADCIPAPEPEPGWSGSHDDDCDCADCLANEEVSRQMAEAMANIVRHAWT